MMINLTVDVLFDALCRIVQYKPKNLEEEIKQKAYIEVFRWILNRENYYDEESCLNEYDVTIFVRDTEAEKVSGKSAGQELFRRFSETHVQRGYTIEQMRRLVERSGMELIRMLDAESLTEADEQSERVYVLARECQKDNPQ